VRYLDIIREEKKGVIGGVGTAAEDRDTSKTSQGIPIWGGKIGGGGKDKGVGVLRASLIGDGSLAIKRVPRRE